MKLSDKIQELRSEWLNVEITLSYLDTITDKYVSGSYDLKRDLMMSEDEGSYDDGQINYEFKFVEGSEISFDGKVVITDIYEL